MVSTIFAPQCQMIAENLGCKFRGAPCCSGVVFLSSAPPWYCSRSEVAVMHRAELNTDYQDQRPSLSITHCTHPPSELPLPKKQGTPPATAEASSRVHQWLMRLIEGQIAVMLVVEDIPCTAMGPLGRSTDGVSCMPSPPGQDSRRSFNNYLSQVPTRLDSFAWRLSIGHFFSQT